MMTPFLFLTDWHLYTIMYYMNGIIQSIQPATATRNNLFSLLDKITAENSGIVVTRNNTPQAVILPYILYESLSETLDILEDKHLLQDIHDSQTDTHYIPLEEFITGQDIGIADRKYTYGVSGTHKRKGRKISRKNR